MRHKLFGKSLLIKFIFVIVLLIAWDSLAKSGIYSQHLLPPLSVVWTSLWSDVLDGQLPRAVLNSMTIIIFSMVIAIVISLILVILSHLSKICDEVIDLVIAIAHPLPGIALLPLVIMWFGIGSKAIMFVICHAMIWPLLITVKAETKKIRIKHDRLRTTFEIDKLDFLYKVYILGAIPSMLSGIKIAWSRGWRGFISSEMIFGIVGNASGLGWYIFEKRVFMDTGGLFAGLIAVMICGVVVEHVIFKPIEDQLKVRWLS